MRYLIKNSFARLMQITFLNFWILRIVTRLRDSFSFGKRFSSAITDLIQIFIPFVPIWVLISLYFMYSDITIDNSSMIHEILMYVPNAIAFFIYLNKDFYKSRSIGKREFGYQIIDYRSGELSSEMQNVIRNCTILIWPIELIFIFLNPSRRLGDFIAGTSIIDTYKIDSKSIIQDIKQFEETPLTKKTLLLTISLLIIGFGFKYLIVGLAFANKM